MIDGERYTGPQKVSMRAQEIERCPVEGHETDRFWAEFEPLDLSFSGYPPFGLPEIYREPHMKEAS